MKQPETLPIKKQRPIAVGLRRFVRLRCPKCNKTLRSPRLASDPPKTYEVRMTCHECQNGGYDDTAYYDKSGKEIAQPNG